MNMVYIVCYKLITYKLFIVKERQQYLSLNWIILVIFLSWLGCMLLLTEELEMMQNVAYGPLQLR